jgi:hypothetical protein
MSVGYPNDPLPGPHANMPRCATCVHWEYADKYTPEWHALPLTHLWSYGECALFNDEDADVVDVKCGACSARRRSPSIDTHWTFGCIGHEPRP